jgi:PAS domain S-box-containing protein
MRTLKIPVVEESAKEAALLAHVLRSAGFGLRWKQAQPKADDATHFQEPREIVLSNDPPAQFNRLEAAGTGLQTEANAILITDRSGRILRVNPAFTSLTGYSEEEVIGKTPRVLKSGAHTQKFYDNFWRTIADGRTWRGEFINRRTDGTLYCVKHTVTPIRSIGGEITHFVGVMNDVTERKKLEAEVALREQRLNSFFIGAPAGLVLLDKDLRFVQINDTLARMNGLAPKEHLGRPIQEILPKLAPKLVPLLRKVLNTGESKLNIEICGETPLEPGKERHWLASYFPVGVKNGKPEGLGAIVVEITERKQAEQELKFRNAIMSTQMEVAIDGMLVVDADGKVVSYNFRFARMWGIPPQVLKDTDHKSVLHFGINKVLHPTAFLRRVQHIYQHRRKTSRDEIVLKDGSVFDRFSSPMSGPDGRYYGRIWYFHDITERKKAELELRHSREQLRALAARMHAAREEESLHISRTIHDELGHALTSLSIDLVALRKSLALDRPLPNKMALRVEAMSKLVEQTTGVVQRIAMELRPNLLDDLGLAEAMEWLVDDLAARTGIRFQWRQKLRSFKVPKEHAIVVFRIFQEILTNIVRHAKATTVTLSCRKNKGSLAICVRDDGIGFNQKSLQTHDSLGLIGLRERTLLVGGKLEIYSACGQGTTVILTMPAHGVKVLKPVKSARFHRK